MAFRGAGWQAKTETLQDMTEKPKEAPVSNIKESRRSGCADPLDFVPSHCDGPRMEERRRRILEQDSALPAQPMYVPVTTPGHSRNNSSDPGRRFSFSSNPNGNADNGLGSYLLEQETVIRNAVPSELLGPQLSEVVWPSGEAGPSPEAEADEEEEQAGSLAAVMEDLGTGLTPMVGEMREVMGEIGGGVRHGVGDLASLLTGGCCVSRQASGSKMADPQRGRVTPPSPPLAPEPQVQRQQQWPGRTDANRSQDTGGGESEEPDLETLGSPAQKDKRITRADCQ